MGAGVNAERFEREIQLAARLQHPHIVPLLTAGALGRPPLLHHAVHRRRVAAGAAGARGRAAGGRGDPDPPRGGRRAGLRPPERRGPPRHQARQRADVRGARRRHRLRRRQGGERLQRRGHLTSLGLALGTPAYMAPEQAAADPHVDHRADIYAVGVLAYEMLVRADAVRRGDSPQAMLAAHITQAPDPPVAAPAVVSPALSAAVMRCLEKQRGRPVAERGGAGGPARGRQHAAAAAMTRPGRRRRSRAHRGRDPPRASGAGRRALRRGLRGGARGRLAAGAALGLAGLGAVRAAVASSLIGLPIMLMAGLQERRRAQARTTGLYRPTPGAGWPLASWRRALMGGATGLRRPRRRSPPATPRCGCSASARWARWWLRAC